MNNIKKILIYPLAFVLFFGLTSNTCDSLDDIAPDIEIPIDNVVVFNLEVTEEALAQSSSFRVTEIIDPSSPELEKYKDQIEDFKLRDVELEVVDLLSGESEGQLEGMEIGLDFDRDGNAEAVYIFTNIEDFDSRTLSLSDFDRGERVESAFRDAIENGQSIDLVVDARVGGPLHYQITATISGTTLVSP